MPKAKLPRCPINNKSILSSYRSLGCRCPLCAELGRAYQRQWSKKNPKLAARISRKNSLSWKFNLTEEDYTNMFKEQNGKCAICGSAPEEVTKGKRRLSVDHCHKTGQIRGLLCSKCNHAIGSFKDSLPLILSAAKYLVVHSQRKEFKRANLVNLGRIKK